MKVLIFEQFSGGHYTNYCRHLIEKFVNETKVDTIFIATTEKHIATEAFRDYLSLYKNKIKVIIVPDNVSSAGKFKDRFKIFINLVNILKVYKCDVVISTTADFISTFSSIFSLFGYNPMKKVKSIGMFHYGYGKEVLSKKDFIKRLTYNITYSMSKWNYKMFVNPIVYYNIKRKKNMYLLSDPVKVNKIYSKKEARMKLNLDMDSRIIGYIGNIDKRKAVLEFLEAFFLLDELNSNDKVLLMGRIDTEYKEIITKKYSTEIESKRIIIFDRHLSYDEIELGLGACDIVSVLYHNAPGLSANMLYAICSEKRVIANSFGFTGMLVDAFDIGTKCSPYNIKSVMEAILKEINFREENSTKEKIEKIAEYYNVKNFQNMIGNIALLNNEKIIDWEELKNKE